MKKNVSKAPTIFINKSNFKNGLKNANIVAVTMKRMLKYLTFLGSTSPNIKESNLVLPTLIKHGKTVSNIKRYKISTISAVLYFK